MFSIKSVSHDYSNVDVLLIIGFVILLLSNTEIGSVKLTDQLKKTWQHYHSKVRFASAILFVTCVISIFR